MVEPFYQHRLRNKPLERFVFDEGKKELETSSGFDMFMHSVLDQDRRVGEQTFLHGATTESLMTKLSDPVEKFKLAMEGVRWIQEDLKAAEEDAWADQMLPDTPEKPVDNDQEEAKWERRLLLGNFTMPHERHPDHTETMPPNLPEKMPIEAERNCYFCNTLRKDKYLNGIRGMEKYHMWNAMNVPMLTRYITGNGAILPKRVTGNCTRHQRKISKVIKKAIHMGFFSWKGSNFRINSPFALPRHLEEHHFADIFNPKTKLDENGDVIETPSSDENENNKGEDEEGDEDEMMM